MKKCIKCQSTKSYDQFYMNARGTRSSYCKSCSIDHASAYAKAHPDKRRVDVKRRRDLFRAISAAWREAYPCVDCGKSYPSYVMDFDHLSDKEFTISQVVGKVSIDRFVAEIMKCEVVCANCHRVRTYNRTYMSD